MRFLSDLSKALNKTPQEAEQITWMMQNRQYDIDYMILGTGGNGVVVRGYDRQEDKSIAIKIMRFNNDDQCERLLGEFKLLQSCSGSQILRVKEIYISYKFKLQFMIMEYCLFDLKKYLREMTEKKMWMKRSETILVCRELIQGLAQIHAKSIIHLDIKPANILFGVDSYWKYSDFGLSRKFKRTFLSPQQSSTEDQSEDKVVTTQYIKIIPEGYTALYASPEQYQFVKEKNYGLVVNDKSDIYSLGLVFLELTGVKITNNIVQRLKIDPTLNIASEMNPQFDQFNNLVLLPMLSYNPNQRPSLSEIAENINALLDNVYLPKSSNSGNGSGRNSDNVKSNSEVDFYELAIQVSRQEDQTFCMDRRTHSHATNNHQEAIDLTEQNIPEIDVATQNHLTLKDITQQAEHNFIKIK